MQYIDTGNRDSTHALGTWLADLDPCKIRSFRWQSGYFSIDGLRPVVPLIQSLARRGLEISCVLGSNEGETAAGDIGALIDLIGCPRPEARVAIIRYGAGLFHPKVYHVTRLDGGQAAYVGSANLTSAGVTGLNVEAGLILDTATGDPEQPLDRMASAVDAWLDEPRSGVERIFDHNDIPPLVASRVLTATSGPTVRSPASANQTGAADRFLLAPLVTFAPVPGAPTFPISGVADLATTSASVSASVVAQPSTPRDGYPAYLLFDSKATVPTQGSGALTAATLPSGAAGLIVKLNRDSARHFSGASGTANLSIPVATMATLRFGILQGGSQRPRAEFDLHMRYIYGASEQKSVSGNTNIMAYGFEAGDTGHGDIRMVVPAGPCRQIHDFATGSGLKVPSIEDPMILQWPTLSDPSFRATFVDSNHALFDELRDLLESATTSGQNVGQGACWLPPGIAPSW